MNPTELLNVIKSRRSTRSYIDKQVSVEDLRLVLEAATYAPSGMNYQTWHFTAIQNQEALQILNKVIKKAFAKSSDKHLQDRGNNENYCCYYHAPTLIIVSNEDTQWWASMDCACAIENMFLMATSLGIGSCWINQLGTTCDDEEVREYIASLGIPNNHKVFGCVALGYANVSVPIKDKSLKDNTISIIL